MLQAAGAAVACRYLQQCERPQVSDDDERHHLQLWHPYKTDIAGQIRAPFQMNDYVAKLEKLLHDKRSEADQWIRKGVVEAKSQEVKPRLAVLKQLPKSPESAFAINLFEEQLKTIKADPATPDPFPPNLQNAFAKALKAVNLKDVSQNDRDQNLPRVLIEWLEDNPPGGPKKMLLRKAGEHYATFEDWRLLRASFNRESPGRDAKRIDFKDLNTEYVALEFGPTLDTKTKEEKETEALEKKAASTFSAASAAIAGSKIAISQAQSTKQSDKTTGQGSTTDNSGQNADGSGSSQPDNTGQGSTTDNSGQKAGANADASGGDSQTDQTTGQRTTKDTSGQNADGSGGSSQPDNTGQGSTTDNSGQKAEPEAEPEAGIIDFSNQSLRIADSGSTETFIDNPTALAASSNAALPLADSILSDFPTKLAASALGATSFAASSLAGSLLVGSLLANQALLAALQDPSGSSFPLVTDASASSLSSDTGTFDFLSSNSLFDPFPSRQVKNTALTVFALAAINDNDNLNNMITSTCTSLVDGLRKNLTLFRLAQTIQPVVLAEQQLGKAIDLIRSENFDAFSTLPTETQNFALAVVVQVAIEIKQPNTDTTDLALSTALLQQFIRVSMTDVLQQTQQAVSLPSLNSSSPAAVPAVSEETGIVNANEPSFFSRLSNELQDAYQLAFIKRLFNELQKEYQLGVFLATVPFLAAVGQTLVSQSEQILSAATTVVAATAAYAI